jgi:tetratricopeptide (TPR) repeat protein
MPQDKLATPLWMACALTLALAPAVAALPAAAAGSAIHNLYDCQRLAEKTPNEALTQIQAWLAHGGGREAQLCRAAALFHAGAFPDAGKAFEALAADGTGGGREQANLFDRAAWAWLRAGDAARAERLYGAALQHQPDDGDLHLDRGLARAESKHYREAIEDFSAALQQDPHRADAALYRANAWLALDDIRQALSDADQVLKLKPGDGDALLLRGTLRALSGDSPGARLDWRELITREPTSANGKAAAERLHKLEQALAKGKQP